MNPFIKQVLRMSTQWLWGMTALLLIAAICSRNLNMLNNICWFVVVVLLVGAVYLCWLDARKGRVFVQIKRKPVAIKLQMLLIYPSTLSDDWMRTPVNDVVHAQRLVDIMCLKHAHYGYKKYSDGSDVIIHSLTSNGRFIDKYTVV